MLKCVCSTISVAGPMKYNSNIFSFWLLSSCSRILVRKIERIRGCTRDEFFFLNSGNIWVKSHVFSYIYTNLAMHSSAHFICLNAQKLNFPDWPMWPKCPHQKHKSWPYICFHLRLMYFTLTCTMNFWVFKINIYEQVIHFSK